jgi:hypothetical protein
MKKGLTILAVVLAAAAHTLPLPPTAEAMNPQAMQALIAAAMHHSNDIQAAIAQLPAEDLRVIAKAQMIFNHIAERTHVLEEAAGVLEGDDEKQAVERRAAAARVRPQDCGCGAGEESGDDEPPARFVKRERLGEVQSFEGFPGHEGFVTMKNYMAELVKDQEVL